MKKRGIRIATLACAVVMSMSTTSLCLTTEALGNQTLTSATSSAVTSLVSLNSTSFTSKKVTVKSSYSASTSKIKLSWNKVSGASGYRIYRYNSSTKKWVKIKTIKSGSTLSYKDVGLKAGTRYKYKVKAYKKSNGKTVWSKASSTKNVTTKPKSVTFATCSKTTSSITLKWNKVSCSGYQIYQYKSGSWKKIKTISSSSTTSYKVTGLSSNTSYKFKIRAYKSDSTGTKKYGSFVTKSITTSVASPSAPSSVTFATCSKTTNSVTLKWNKVSCSGYQIYQYKSGSWTKIKTISSSSTTSYKVTGLSSGTSYKFKIRAYNSNSAGTAYGSYTSKTITTSSSSSSSSSSDSETTITSLNDVVIDNIEVFSPDSIKLSWENCKNATGYEIYQKTGSGSWKKITSITSSYLYYYITDFESDTLYEFKIRAYTTTLNGTIYSNFTEWSPVKISLSPIENGYYTVLSTKSLKLEWDPAEPEYSSDCKYTIYVNDITSSKTIGPVTLSNISSYTFNNLTPFSTYVFMIIKSETTSSGVTMYSDTLSFVYTMPGATLSSYTASMHANLNSTYAQYISLPSSYITSDSVTLTGDNISSVEVKGYLTIEEEYFSSDYFSDYTTNFEGTYYDAVVKESSDGYIINIEAGPYGTSTPMRICVTFDNGMVSYYDVTIKIENTYPYVYSTEVLNTWMTENITKDMTDYEKITEITKYVAHNYEYSIYGSSLEYMVITGGGDCWASTSVLCYMAEQLGFSAEWYHPSYAESSTHYCAKITVSDGTSYLCDAGYYDDMPRYYRVTECTD